MTTQFTIVKSHKSVGIAILLTLLFGPIGLFYASVTGGIILTFIVPALLVSLIITGALQSETLLLTSLILTFSVCIFYWLICIIWAVLSIQDYNKQLDEEYRRQQLLSSSQNLSQSRPLFNSAAEFKGDVTYNKKKFNPPSLQDWLKENPGRTIHDYYTKFGNQQV